MLHSRQLRWRTAFSYALAILVVIAGLVYLLTHQINLLYTNYTYTQLTQQAKLVATNSELQSSWAQGDTALNDLLKRWSVALNLELAAYSAKGQLIADSDLAVSAGDNAVALPEVRDALSTGQGSNVREDANSGLQTFYIALPVKTEDKLLGILRLGFPLTQLDKDLKSVQQIVLWSNLAAAAIIICLMVFQTERAAATVRRLTQVVERITAGDLDARIWSLSSGEIGQLARAFNRMATKLQKQMAKRARERNRLNTVLNALSDGVLILNRHGEVRLLNPNAARILQTVSERALGRTFVQAVRDHRIVEVFVRCQQSSQEETAMLELDGGRFLRVVVTPNLKEQVRGYVVILQDLTTLHHLQTVRQDFISNLSHELRTPLASVRALVDTLNDGALEDPPAAQRFLRRMEVEVDALTQMVQELLELSRIESGKAPVRLQEVAAAPAIAAGAERLRTQAERAELSLGIDFSSALPNVIADPDRIQQVVVNLIHNAIKFTPAGGQISLSAQHKETTGEVVVAVRDTGVGIAPEDQPRIFERFYKADRARSGHGTGLGLAIAKHIVQAHGGRIWVESWPGRGSTFFFSLPTADHPINQEAK
jgi:two-component system phosphate regulon sensor histidine kinase PhoR